MGRVSSTFKLTIENMTRAYADEYGISFSEAIEILTGHSVTEWWDKLSKKKQKELRENFKSKK
jgi:hypothetical protein